MRARRPPCLLIVDGSRGLVPDVAQSGALATALAGEGLEGVRAAFVDARAEGIARIEVGEIVARGHGDRFRVSEGEALAWIWLRYGRDCAVAAAAAVSARW